MRCCPIPPDAAPAPAVRTDYRQAPPHPRAAGVLRRAYRIDVGTDHRLLVPDACIDLVWVHDRLVVCGTDTQAWDIGVPPGTRAVGVRFHPGHGHAVLGVGGAEVVEQRLDVAEVCGRDGARLVQRLGETGSTAWQLHLLQRFVADRWAELGDEPQPFADELVQRTLRLGAGGVGPSRPPGVSALAASLGLSTRQLHRRTTDVFGYGPAVLARILRLQRFLHLRATTTATLAQLAAASGYADQAHLARECRDLLGRPPSALDGAVAGLDDAAPMSDLFKRRAA